MNGRRRFDRPEYWTAIIPFLLLLLLHSTSGFALSNSVDFSYRRLLQGVRSSRPRSSPFNRNSISPSPPPSQSVLPVSPSPAPIQNVPLAMNRPEVVAASAAKRSQTHLAPIVGGVLGGAFLLMILAIGFVVFRNNKAVTVKPWATGLSGQLQKAFVTGVPKLNRSEIVVACEDFSNIIGSVKEGTVYKGTLSSGVEIAVTSTAVKSRHDWSKTSEEQFRKKIKKLSKVNHKNFVNLIGFCEEEQEPFTRVMVFEYAPNGTLFEHLHIKEAEHLDWETRLRIAMGMAYCLDHMHKLSPPIALTGLHSSSVYLTEDYAAKLSDFRSWNEVTATKMDSVPDPIPEEASPESNVYGFGAILFEIITGRAAASENLEGELCLRCPREIVDPTLMSFDEGALEKLFGVIRDCVKADPKERPSMAVVAARMKEITSVTPDGAVPKLSPLWWAELEICSTDLS